MTEIHDPAPSEAPRGVAPRRGRGRAAVAIIAIALAGGILGGVASKALAEGPGFGFGPPWGHHGGGFMRGAVEPEQIDRRIERAVKHMAVEIDASPEQTSRLVQIAQATARDLLPLREQMRELRGKAVELLSAPTVDRAAVEQLRATQLQRFDAASKRLTQGLTEAAEVLKPEQRKELAERAERWRERMERWRHG